MYLFTCMFICIFCGIHENAPLKFPAVGTVIDKLQCFRTHHCIFSEAMLLMNYSQLMTKQGRRTTSDLLPKDARLLLLGNFAIRTPHWLGQNFLKTLLHLRFFRANLYSFSPSFPSSFPPASLTVLPASSGFFPFFPHRHLPNKSLA